VPLLARWALPFTSVIDPLLAGAASGTVCDAAESVRPLDKMATPKFASLPLAGVADAVDASPAVNPVTKSNRGT